MCAKHSYKHLEIYKKMCKNAKSCIQTQFKILRNKHKEHVKMNKNLQNLVILAK